MARDVQAYGSAQPVDRSSINYGKQTVKQWHFFDKVYRVWVVVCIGPEDEFKQFLEDSTYTEPFEYSDSSGYCIHLCAENTTNGNNAYVIWMRNFETACLVHELSHLCMMVFDSKGVPVRTENTEAYAYYIEFWLNEINRTRRRLPNGRGVAETKRALAK